MGRHPGDRRAVYERRGHDPRPEDVDGEPEERVGPVARDLDRAPKDLAAGPGRGARACYADGCAVVFFGSPSRSSPRAPLRLAARPRPQTSRSLRRPPAAPLPHRRRHPCRPRRPHRPPRPSHQAACAHGPTGPPIARCPLTSGCAAPRPSGGLWWSGSTRRRVSRFPRVSCSSAPSSANVNSRYGRPRSRPRAAHRSRSSRRTRFCSLSGDLGPKRREGARRRLLLPGNEHQGARRASSARTAPQADVVAARARSLLRARADASCSSKIQPRRGPIGVSRAAGAAVLHSPPRRW